MIIKVIVVDGVAKKFQKEVVKTARKLAGLLSKKGLIEVYLISGKRMQAFNKGFRGKNKSTNVLSFVTPKNFPDDALGEVYIDPIYVDKKGEDLSLMLVHGVLHILGYDHKKKGDKITMEQKEKDLLQKLAISK